MPSPFPGMDPYLEGNEWGSFHVELSVEIRRWLTPQVRPRYVVRAMKRFIAELSDGAGISRQDIYPDTGVVREVTAVWETPASAPVEVATIISEPAPHYAVEIRTAAGNDLVTSIEVLSPANKRGHGYIDYLEKRERILHSQAHLIEIDWLRDGRRVPTQEPLPPAPYYVFLSRAEKRPIMDVWPIQFTSRLPTIPVPLLPGDEDATLDLQRVFETVYDSLEYRTSIDYTQPPEIPLVGETAVWVQTLLAEAGYHTD